MLGTAGMDNYCYYPGCFGIAGTLGYFVQNHGRFIKRSSGFNGTLGLALHFETKFTLENVAVYRSWVSVRRAYLARLER